MISLSFRCALLLGLVALTPVYAASSVRSIPVEDFTRYPEVTHAQLSPSGTTVAYISWQENRSSLHYLDLQTAKVLNVRHILGGQEEEVDRFEWLGPTRVAFLAAETIDEGFAQVKSNATSFSIGKRTGIIRRYTTGWSAMDLDGGRWVALTGLARDAGINDVIGLHIIHVYKDQPFVLMTTGSYRGDSFGAEQFYPDVIKLDHVSAHYDTVAKNPGDVVYWGADRTGEIRFSETLHGAHSEIRYRTNVAAPWRTIASSEDPRHALVPLNITPDERAMFVRALTPGGFWGLARMDLATGAVAPVFSTAGYDVIPPESFGTTYDAVAMESLVLAHDQVVGLRYLTDRPHSRWIERRRAQLQVDLDAALPGVTNTIVSASDDDRRFLILSWSDRDPGTYYTYNVDNGTLKKMAPQKGWIHPEEMAPMKPIEYAARDGLPIHGYLTLPVGTKPGSSPLVVYVHGGPWARDTWSFEPMVQFLANRGYSVLQVNYRGSTGFGEEAMSRSVRQIGGAVQDDITDGVKWAIGSGYADPARIAIMGASFGGYSALEGATHTPELYRCAIDISGPSDWTAMLKESKTRDVDYAYSVWSKRIGSLKDDQTRLKEISPVNYAANVRTPILIIQGEIDRTVPPIQARLMIDALKSHNKDCESLFFPDEDHGIFKDRNRVREYQAIEKFLLHHLPP